MLLRNLSMAIEQMRLDIQAKQREWERWIWWRLGEPLEGRGRHGWQLVRVSRPSDHAIPALRAIQRLPSS
jgi:hypothetical protein